MTEPSSFTIAVWLGFGAFLNAVFGVSQQSVTVALIGTAAWALLLADSTGENALPRWKFVMISVITVIGSAIAANGLGEFFTWGTKVVNVMAFAFSVSGPYAWRKIPGWIELFVQKWAR